MVKGIVGSLIAAAVFFLAGEITIKVMGTRSLGEKEFKEMELFKDAPSLAEIIKESKFTGVNTWEFNAEETLGIVSSKAETVVKRVNGDNITLTVKTSGNASAAVTVAESRDGYLGISVRGNTLLFGSGEIKVEIGLPDKEFKGFETALGSGEMKALEIKAQRSVLDIGAGKMTYKQAADFEARELKIEMGSGKVDASEIKAKSTEIDVGSGLLEYAQAEGYKGEKLEVDIGSGSVTVTNADVLEYEISMGSGMFDVSGLTGFGEIDIGSGKGTAEFAAIDPRGSEIDMSSGSLAVYVPRDCGAQIEADISTGMVKVDCCGIYMRFTKDGYVTLGDGGGKFAVDVSSGKVEFLESKRFETERVKQIADVVFVEK